MREVYKKVEVKSESWNLLSHSYLLLIFGFAF